MWFCQASTQVTPVDLSIDARESPQLSLHQTRRWCSPPNILLKLSIERSRNPLHPVEEVGVVSYPDSSAVALLFSLASNHCTHKQRPGSDPRQPWGLMTSYQMNNQARKIWYSVSTSGRHQSSGFSQFSDRSNEPRIPGDLEDLRGWVDH